MQRSSKFARLLGAVAALCLASGLAACGGSDAATVGTGATGGVIIPLEDVDTTTDPLDVGSAVPAPTETAASAAAATPAATATASAAVPGSCLVGNWSVSASDVAGYLARASNGFSDVTASGQLSLSFTASSYSWVQAAQVDVTIAAGTDEARPAAITMSRTLTGPWSASSSAISAPDSADDLVYTITEGGVALVDTGDLFQGFLGYNPVDGMAYSCNGPTVNLPINDGTGSTYPVTLR